GDALEDTLTPELARALFGAEGEAVCADCLRAQGQVRDALAAVIGGANGKRAVLAYQRVDARAPGSMPPQDVAPIVRAAGTARSSAMNGREGIVGPIEAENAALALRDLSPDERATVSGLIDAADIRGSADPSAAQALILKAIAARRAIFCSGDAAAR